VPESSPGRVQARPSPSRTSGQSVVPPDNGASDGGATESTIAVVETTEAVEQIDATQSLRGGPAIATPNSSTGATRLAVPVLGSAALASALLALEVTKRPRRRPGMLPAVAVPDTNGSRS